jgi:hypothetical protein
MLQYCRFATPPDEFVTALAAHAQKVALGTARGTLWILDSLDGASAPGVRIEAHGGGVRDLSWDVSGKFVGSCGHNTIAVHGRKLNETCDLDANSWERLNDQACVGVSSVTLDPRYGAPARALYCGDRVGRVEKRAKGLVATSRTTVDDSDDFEVTQLLWTGAFVAWICDAGVKLAHADTATPAAFLACEGEGATALTWATNDDLLVARGDTVRRIAVQIEGWDEEGLPMTQASVTHTFRTDVVVLHIAPHDAGHVCLLGEGGELQILNNDGDVVSSDALPQITSGKLASTSTEHWSRENWRLLDDPTLKNGCAGTAPTLYVVGERVIAGRVRDGDDVLDLCLAQGDTHNALRIASSTPLVRHELHSIAAAHVRKLLADDPPRAAAVCLKFCTNLAEWVAVFDNYDQLPGFAVLLPASEKRRLARSVYDDVLERLATRDGRALLATIRAWGDPTCVDPPLYDASIMADAFTTTHPEAAAELFVFARRPEKALQTLLDVTDTSVANETIRNLVEDHGLFDDVARNAQRFVRAARGAAALLFAAHPDVLPVDEIGEQLAGDDLKWYLLLCFEKLPLVFRAPELAKWHDAFVALHASTTLSRFLRTSVLFDKDKALVRCRALRQFRDCAHVLGLLGRAGDALDLLVGEGDLAGAALHAASSPEALKAYAARAKRNPGLIAAALDAAAAGSGLDLASILGPCVAGLEVPGLRQRYVGVLQAKRLDVAIADAANACAAVDAELAFERKLRVASRGVLVEPPFEFDADGNILIERWNRYY